MRWDAKQLKSGLTSQRTFSFVTFFCLPRFTLILMLASVFSVTAIAKTADKKTPGAAQSATPIIDYQQRFLPTVGRNGMVVAPEKLAAEVGLSVLQAGGNAVDAAVATGFALAVTYPRAGNLGGGGFMLIHLAEQKKQTFIDYREIAPSAATADLFLDDKGEVDKMREYFSHLSAGVPGTVAGLLLAQERYGLLSREQVLSPALTLAREGIPVSYALNFEINARASQLRRNAEAARLFLDEDGDALEVGQTWKQSDLAWTLAQIQNSGFDGFYKGPVAERIAQEMQRGNGLMTQADLADYRAIERKPVRGTFRGFEIVSAPPPSSGGIHIIQMLNILEGFELASMGHNSAAYLHHLAESMKLAYADRSIYLGDPDFVDVPTAKLIDKHYAERQRKTISSDRARPAADIAPGAQLDEGGTETTHYSVADRFGNVVSNTYTLNFSFGSHIAVPGTGMLLNNEMADFAARPGFANAFGLVQGEANKIEPRKRPLSSMSPTIVLKDGAPWLATGSPGGSIIINTVLQTILNAMEFDMNIATAAAEPRIHHQWMPDTLRVEQGISIDTLNLLREKGHPVEVGNRTQGRTNSLMLEYGWLYGATDSRRPGGWVAAY